MNFHQKDELRKHIWTLIDNQNFSKRPKGDYGRIPDFIGSERAAQLLSHTIEWDDADVIFCSPDSAQKKVREIALSDGKYLIMPSPKLKKGYFIVNGSVIVPEKIQEASTISGVLKFGENIEQFPPVDLVVEGSVAVDRDGNRLGKDGGYGDQEIRELYDQKVIDKTTPIVSTVHNVQIVEKVPTEIHDEKINMIVTPEEVIRLNRDRNIAVVR